MKMDADTFRELFAKSGGKTIKGRPVIDSLFMEQKEQGNRHVKNAKKVYNESGQKIADSRWEHTCHEALKASDIPFEPQRKFILLEKIRSKWMGKTLRTRSWTPDFTFEQFKVVADAKGFTTQVAKLKMHLFLEKYAEWDIVLLYNLNDLYNFINLLKRAQY